MKPTSSNRLLTLLGLATVLGSLPLHAAFYYWDLNGTAAGGAVDRGAGGTADGTWENGGLTWNTGSVGTNPVAAVTTTTADTINFSAGVAGSSTTITAPYTVTVAGTQAAAALNFFHGSPTLTGGTINLRDTNSGVTKNLVNGGSATTVIDSDIKIVNVNANKLLVLQNNRNLGLDVPGLDINGSISTEAVGGEFRIRYEGVTGSVTRLDGPISNLLFINQASGTWAGDLIIGGNQSLGGASISIFDPSVGNTGTPASTARLVLGESSEDEQTWNNVSLANVMNLGIGGTISANTFTGNLPGTRITGASDSGSISFTSGTIGTNVVLGGSEGNEDNLSITKKGIGVLNINSDVATYTGTTTVEEGTLNIASSLASDVIVEAGTTLGGEGSTTGSLTFEAGSSTLNFNPATPESFTATSVSMAGATILASPSGATTVGTPYTVLTRTSGTFSAGDVSSFLAGGRATLGGSGTSTITYTPTSPVPVTWKGNDGTNPSFWDIAATFNWSTGSPSRFFTNDPVTFDDTASTFAVAIQGASVTPGNITFNNNSANDYTVSGGTINGSASFTKSGTGTVTLTQTGTNTFSGALKVNAGTLSISNATQIGGLTSTRSIELGGGTLRYTYDATASQTSNTLPIVLNPGTSTIEISGTISGSGVNPAIVPVTLRTGAPVTGSGNLIKSGPGTLALGLNSVGGVGSTFTGTILVAGGTLDARSPDSLGTTTAGTTIDNAAFQVFPFGQNAGVTYDPEPLAFVGDSFFRLVNEDSDSDIVNTWTGPVSLANNAVVGISSPKAFAVSTTTPNTLDLIHSAFASELVFTGTVVTGSGSVLKLGLIPPNRTLPIIQSSVPQTVTVAGDLTGSGSIETQGAADSSYTLASPGYSGDTTVNGGKLSLGANNSDNDASTVRIANDATLELNFVGIDTVDKLFIGGTRQPAGDYTSAHASGTIEGDGTLRVTSGGSVSPFENWMATNYPGIPNGQTGPADDFDKDGSTNLAEFALDGNPASGASSGKISSKIATVGGASTLVITLPVRNGATFAGATEEVSAPIDGLVYRIQSSDDLIGWTTLMVDEVTGPDAATIQFGMPALSSGWTYRTFRSPGGVAGDPGEFIRAAVVAAP